MRLNGVPRWRLLLFARTFSVFVGLAAALCAARAVLRTAPILRGYRLTVFSTEFHAQLRYVEDHVPAGDSVLYVTASWEGWFSRLWQRALYPRNRTIVVQPPDHARLPQLRAKYGARFALSAGNPPLDPGYLWKTDFGPTPGAPIVTLFGELKP